MKRDIEADLERYHKREAKKEQIVKRIIKTRELIDEDGYPTTWAGLCIRLWPSKRPMGWFEFIGQMWAYKDWGWSESVEPHEYRKDVVVRRYRISTAGWSGNEYLIRMMQQHEWLWYENWVQSRRGGHYIFDVEIKDEHS